MQPDFAKLLMVTFCFRLSWSLVYFVIILVVTSIVTVIAAVSKFFQDSNMFLLWLMLMLYGLSIIALAFLLTPFFKKARAAGEWGFNKDSCSFVYTIA